MNCLKIRPSWPARNFSSRAMDQWILVHELLHALPYWWSLLEECIFVSSPEPCSSFWYHQSWHLCGEAGYVGKRGQLPSVVSLLLYQEMPGGVAGGLPFWPHDIYAVGFYRVPSYLPCSLTYKWNHWCRGPVEIGIQVLWFFWVTSLMAKPGGPVGTLYRCLKKIMCWEKSREELSAVGLQRSYWGSKIRTILEWALPLNEQIHSLCYY